MQIVILFEVANRWQMMVWTFMDYYVLLSNKQ